MTHRRRRRQVILTLEWTDETERTGHGPPFTSDEWEYAINGEFSGDRVKVVECLVTTEPAEPRHITRP